MKGKTMRRIFSAGTLIVLSIISLTASSTSWTSTGTMHHERVGHTATLLKNGLVLIAGGDSNGGEAVLAAAELYNPSTGKFTVTGSMHFGREGHRATLLNNGMVLITGGYSPFTTTGTLSSAELYNPATGKFDLTGSMNAPRTYHTATLLDNGMVLVTGGQPQKVAPQASAEIYDPANGHFSFTGSMHSPRADHTATLLNNGNVLVAGGYFENSSGLLIDVDVAEIYNPSTRVFTTTGAMKTARDGQTATLLDDGMVLLTGGFNTIANASLASAELYDSATGTFAFTGNMKAARSGHTANLMDNGMVLIAAGERITEGTNITDLATAELYDSRTSSFSYTGSLLSKMAGQSATLLENGKVLVAGGVIQNGDNQTILNTAEIY
jgi:N-acetylneuraminic acid mutarotase